MYIESGCLAFNEIYPYLVDDDLVIKEIKKEFKNNIADVLNSIKNTDYLEIDGVYCDFLMDVMNNSARIYTKFTAKGDNGNYPIYVRGLGGIYFVDALEFDNVGYFTSLSDAEDYATSNWFHLASLKGRRYRNAFVRNESIKSRKINNYEDNIIPQIKIHEQFNILNSIREILEEPAQSGCYNLIRTFPSGKIVTISCSWSSGMGSLMMLQKYRNRFDDAPKWLKLCHPYHCSKICKLALEYSVKIPEEFNDLEKYYIENGGVLLL